MQPDILYFCSSFASPPPPPPSSPPGFDCLDYLIKIKILIRLIPLHACLDYPQFSQESSVCCKIYMQLWFVLISIGTLHGVPETDPQKKWQGGSGEWAGVEVYTAPDLQAHFRGCAFTRNANCHKSRHCVLESCKHRVGKIRTLLRVPGSAERSIGYGRFKQFLIFHSIYFYPAPFTRPPFRFSRRVWEWD